MALDLENVPDVFIDIGYIPAEILFDGAYFPRFLIINHKKWEINLNSNVPYYEPYVAWQLRG